MQITDKAVQAALTTLTDPNTKKDFVSGKSVKNIQISGNDITLDILLGYPAKSVWGEIKRWLKTTSSLRCRVSARSRRMSPAKSYRMRYSAG